MDSLIVTLLAVLFAAGAGGGVVWLVMDRRQLAQRISQLEQQLSQAQSPRWAQEMRLDHRAQLVSVAALVQLTARDNLDALMRLSPEMVREVVEQIAPHLFTKENIR